MMDMSSRFLNNENNTIPPIEVKQEPLDFSTPPLDLRTSRKRPPSPSPYEHYQQSKTIPVFIEPPPTMPMSSSPNSNTGSDTSETGSENTIHSYSNYPSSPQLISRAKATRPFKAYPKDPMSMAVGSTTTDTGTDSTYAYSEFRQRMLSQVQSSHNGTNKNMRRISQSMQNPQNNDPNYWEKRKKNNEAAKRSRDARRAKEDEIAIRCAFLEQENMQLKFRIAGLEAERERLQNIMYH